MHAGSLSDRSFINASGNYGNQEHQARNLASNRCQTESANSADVFLSLWTLKTSTDALRNLTDLTDHQDHRLD